MPLTDGTKYLPRYNWAYGMNDEVAYQDRVTFATSTEMLTTGVAEDWYVFGSLEVGGAYDLDPAGEMRDDKTFAQDDPKAAGQIGMLATAGGSPQGTMSLVGDGKKVAAAAQNYSPGIRNPGKGD